MDEHSISRTFVAEAPLSLSMRKQDWLYRAYRDGDEGERLLYVGIASDVWKRIMQHRQRSPWYPLACHLEFERFSSRYAASIAEAHAIRYELPEYNRREEPGSTERIERPLGSAEDWWRSTDGRWFVAFDDRYEGTHAA